MKRLFFPFIAVACLAMISCCGAPKGAQSKDCKDGETTSGACSAAKPAACCAADSSACCKDGASVTSKCPSKPECANTRSNVRRVVR